MSDPVLIREAADVSQATLEAAEEVFEGWFDNDGEPIDWMSFWIVSRHTAGRSR